MDTLYKLEVLKDTYSDEAELDLILGKLLDVALSQYWLRLERYEHDLREFEKRYGMEPATFYRRFEAGELGDAMDFFEWAGLYELFGSGREDPTSGVGFVKDAADYLAHIKALIVVNPQVVHWTVVREEVQGDLGLFRYRLTLRDSGLERLVTKLTDHSLP
jgi:hypothetical protein